MITAYSVGMRVEGLPSRLSRHWNQVRKASTCVSLKVCHRGHASPRVLAPFSITRRPDATPGTVASRLRGGGAGADGLAGDHVKDKATAERHVQPLGQGCETRVRLDLQLVPGDEHAVQT